MRVFVDTNVLIDFVDSSLPIYTVEEILKMLEA